MFTLSVGRSSIAQAIGWFHWFHFVSVWLGYNGSKKDLESSADNNTSTINDLGSLKKGIVKTSNKGNTPYTLVLVGDTGVGKTSALELIANVLAGKDIDHYDLDILKRTEQGDSGNQSQDNLVHLYELTSINGVEVRILDTPGFVDTRGPEEDKIYKKSITTEIQKYTDSDTAVLVLINGTVSRGTGGLALSTLPDIVPNVPAKNIAFMFTNTSGPLFMNFPVDAIPDNLKDAPQFLLNNPIALQKRYLKHKDDPNMRKQRTVLRELAQADEENALRILVGLFDWLDSLKGRPRMEVVPPYKEYQTIVVKVTNCLAQQMNEWVKKDKEKVQEGVRKIKRALSVWGGKC